MRIRIIAGLLVGVVLMAFAVSGAVSARHEHEDRTVRDLRAEAQMRGLRLARFLERAGTGMQTLAGMPAVTRLTAGSTGDRGDVVGAFRSYMRSHPGLVGEIGFVDARGRETIALDAGGRERPHEGDDPSEDRDVALARSLTHLTVRSAHPYREEGSGWVLPITVTVRHRGHRAVLHATLLMAPLVRELDAARGVRILVIDRHEEAPGTVLLDPAEGRIGEAITLPRAAHDATRIEGRPAVGVTVVPPGPGDEVWELLAVSPDPATGTLDHVGPLSVLLGLLGIASLTAAALASRRAGHTLRRAAETDALTGLGNRRRLLADLASTDGDPRTVVLLDLNGFKAYNDLFGHAAGDALLRRLAARLRDAVAPGGRAYRLGGDEFCVIGDARGGGDLLDRARGALSEHGAGFEVTAAAGGVVMPEEAAGHDEALELADRRMYADKREGRRTSSAQIHDVLLAALRERSPDLHRHSRGVAALADLVGERLGLEPEEILDLRTAADLHDIGKVAVPDSILDKPGPLDAEETRFLERHTLIGERILLAAPMLAHVARVVRATHERWDGGGYPDGLAGAAIPLAARIISACDAFDAMTTRRSYRAALPEGVALAELRRCAGTQFDPEVGRVLCEVIEAGAREPVRGPSPDDGAPPPPVSRPGTEGRGASGAAG